MSYWDNKEKLKKQAISHTSYVQDIYKNKIEQCMNDSIIYGVNFNCNRRNEQPMSIIIEDLDSVSAVFKYDNSTVLNFASYKEPGGMFFKGSSAQEECLCHSSFLYNVLSKMTDFYEWNNKNKNKAMYLNRGIYSPNILFMKDNQTCQANVITCAAPNKGTAQKYQNISNEVNTKYLKERIKFVLDIARENNVSTLILGAYGCGAFGQNPIEVANIFKNYLTTTYKCFDKVVFAIPKGINYDKFVQVFKEVEECQILS